MIYERILPLLCFDLGSYSFSNSHTPLPFCSFPFAASAAPRPALARARPLQVFSSMADAPVSVGERKFIRNPLLSRKQFILEVMHPGKANLSRAELQAQVAKVSDLVNARTRTLPRAQAASAS